MAAAAAAAAAGSDNDAEPTSDVDDDMADDDEEEDAPAAAKAAPGIQVLFFCKFEYTVFISKNIYHGCIVSLQIVWLMCVCLFVCNLYGLMLVRVFLIVSVLNQ